LVATDPEDLDPQLSAFASPACHPTHRRSEEAEIHVEHSISMKPLSSTELRPHLPRSAPCLKPGFLPAPQIRLIWGRPTGPSGFESWPSRPGSRARDGSGRTGGLEWGRPSWLTHTRSSAGPVPAGSRGAVEVNASLRGKAQRKNRDDRQRPHRGNHPSRLCRHAPIMHHQALRRLGGIAPCRRTSCCYTRPVGARLTDADVMLGRCATPSFQASSHSPERTRPRLV
jgi:hypothetical protein